MSELHKSTEILKKHKTDLREKYHVKKLGIFGSVAKGYAKKSSDIDILVEFSITPNFFEFIDLEDHLGRLLKKKVDLVTPKALKTSMKKEILNSIKYV